MDAFVVPQQNQICVQQPNPFGGQQRQQQQLIPFSGIPQQPQSTADQ